MKKILFSQYEKNLDNSHIINVQRLKKFKLQTSTWYIIENLYNNAKYNFKMRYDKLFSKI